MRYNHHFCNCDFTIFFLFSLHTKLKDRLTKSVYIVCFKFTLFFFLFALCIFIFFFFFRKLVAFGIFMEKLIVIISCNEFVYILINSSRCRLFCLLSADLIKKKLQLKKKKTHLILEAKCQPLIEVPFFLAKKRHSYHILTINKF